MREPRPFLPRIARDFASNLAAELDKLPAAWKTWVSDAAYHLKQLTEHRKRSRSKRERADLDRHARFWTARLDMLRHPYRFPKDERAALRSDGASPAILRDLETLFQWARLETIPREARGRPGRPDRLARALGRTLRRAVEIAESIDLADHTTSYRIVQAWDPRVYRADLTGLTSTLRPWADAAMRAAGREGRPPSETPRVLAVALVLALEKHGQDPSKSRLFADALEIALRSENIGGETLARLGAAAIREAHRER